MSRDHSIKPHPLPAPYVDLTSPPHEDRVLPFLQKYGKQMICVFVALFALFVVALIWQVRGKVRSEAEYIAAEHAFSALQQLPAGQQHVENNPNYQRLSSILTRYPELGSRYNGELAQTLLRIGNVPLAMHYADLALRDLSAERLPFYEEYAKSSLLLTEGHEREAYKRAVLLQKRMEEALKSPNPPVEFGRVLFFLNQLRIATLLEKMHMPQESALAWTTVQMDARTTQDPLLSSLLSGWHSGSLSFLRYLENQKMEPKSSI